VAFLIRAARLMAPCVASAEGMSLGDKVYLDLMTRKLTSASEDSLLCGVVAADAEPDAEWVEVVLDGVLGVLA
jgi:predicted RecA/RadA family phage recombinase